jgi:hypothetical protein
MEFRAEIISKEQDAVTLRMIDDLHLKALLASEYKGRLFATLDTYEKDKITADQRKHIFALFKDYEEYTGVPIDSVEAFFKYQFMVEKDLDEFPSLARNNMSLDLASEFISYLIEYYIQNDIPFRKQQFYLTTDTSKMLYALTMKRICWICGKPHADIHHATNLVGQGNKRKNHDHWNSTFMALCREHHNEAHTMGLDEFMSTYHVKPVKLKPDELRILGVM